MMNGNSQWVNVWVQIKLNGFSADYKTKFLYSDFTRFKDSIEKVLNGIESKCMFNTLEETFELIGNLDKELIYWNGIATHPVTGGSKLIFNIETNKIRLQDLIQEIDDDLDILQ